MTRCVILRFFSSPLMGPVKNELRTLCMRVLSPGARVGHAWLNVLATKGICRAVFSTSMSAGVRRGIEIGRFGFAVATVGSGGRASISGVRPGTRSATTLLMRWAFCSRDPNPIRFVRSETERVVRLS
jgi:hypothetical protein